MLAAALFLLFLQADSARERGLLAFQNRDYKTAAIQLTAAIDSEEKGTATYLEIAAVLGKSLYLAHDYNAALPWLGEVYRSGDRSAEVLQLLGVSGIHTSQVDVAREAFAALYRVPPGSAAAYLFTAQMMIREDSEQSAELQVRKALELEPKLPGARFIAGELAIARGEIEEAVNELAKEISYNPMHSSAYYRLGDAYLRLDKLDEAIGELRKSIWLNPYFSSPYILLGRAYYQKGEYTNAEEILRYATTIDTNNYAAHYMLGRTLVKLGRQNEADEVFRKAKSLPRDRAALP